MEFLNQIDWSFWTPILTVLILVCFSAFFSGSETALTAVSKARMLTLEKEGNARAKIVNTLIERRDRLIGALLLGNNLVNILASAITTAFLIRLVGDAGVVYATLIMTIVVLVFAEVLPKTYALAHSDKMALMIAPIIRIVVLVFSPITVLISYIVNFTMKIFRIGDQEVNMADMAVQELRGAIELAHDSEGGNEGDQSKDSLEKRAMLRSVMDLVDVDVEDVMTHRSKVTAININQSTKKIVDEVLNSPYTRLPVWIHDKDNIIGIIHSKILLKELMKLDGEIEKLSIEKILLAPWFVPETTTLFDQLQAFRQRKEHFAIVVDEYGTFQGITTLEDVLEEIVGEINDEHDMETTGVTVQPNGSYLVEGRVTVRDLNRELDWELPDENYTTIAGLIIHESKMVPVEGQSFSFFDYRFKIIKRERNQITMLSITSSKT